MCDYPTSHQPSPVNHFIVTVFIEDGVRMFYGKNHPADCRNNLSKENFKDIQDGKLPLKMINSKGETTNYTPPDMKTSKEIACSMKHSNIYCVDIDGRSCDDKNFSWNDIPAIFQQCPYTKSRNKKLPHFYFRMSGIDHTILKRGIFMNASNNLNFCKGELLTNTTWETNKGVVWNYDSELPTLAWDEVKAYLNPSEVTKFETQAQLRTLPTIITFDKKEEKEEKVETTSKKEEKNTKNSQTTETPQKTTEENADNLHNLRLTRRFLQRTIKWIRRLSNRNMEAIYIGNVYCLWSRGQTTLERTFKKRKQL